MRTYLIKALSLSYFLYLGLYSAAVSANIGDIQFKNFSRSDDTQSISDNNITDIKEGPDGFVWVATFNGLNRYDGYEFVRYQHEPERLDTIPEDFVRQIQFDAKGELWVATFGGLARYDKINNAFKRYGTESDKLHSENIWALGTSIDNQLLVAGSTRLYVYDRQADSFSRYFSGETSLPKEVRTILDSDEYLFIGTYGQGLHVYNKATGAITRNHLINPSSTKSADIIYTLKRIDKHYWIGTDTGLFVLDQDLDVIKHLDNKSDNGIAGLNVRTIEVGQNDNIWIGSQSGLSRVNTQTWQTTTLNQADHLKVVNLKSKFIMSMLLDSKGKTWVGTLHGGLHQHNQTHKIIKAYSNALPPPLGLSNVSVWGIDTDLKNNIWVGNEAGQINKIDPVSGQVSVHLNNTNSANIWKLKVDNFQHLLLATSNGFKIYAINKAGDTELLRTYLAGEQIPDFLLSGNAVWLGSKTNRLRHINLQTGDLQQVELQGDNITEVVPLAMDEMGRLWINSLQGLLFYDVKSGAVTPVTLRGHNRDISINNVVEMPDGFWVATYESGLLKLNKESLEVELELSTKSGQLTNNTVTELLYDGEYLWAAVENSGMYKIAPDTGQVLYHLQDRLFQFNNINENAGTVDQLGNIVVGTSRGLFIINTNEINAQSQGDTALQKPEILDLRFYGESARAGVKDSPLTRPIHLTEHITLQSNDAHARFTLKFAAINLKSDNDIVYEYKLSGLDSKWLEADKKARSATYTNLNFGDYLFEVRTKIANSAGAVRLSEPRKLAITIEPPIYLSRQALIFYCFVLAILLFVWFKQHKNKLAVQRKIAANEERLQLTLWSSGDELYDWDIQQHELHRSNTWGTIDFPQDGVRAQGAYECNIHPSDTARVNQRLDAHLQGNSEHFEITYRVKNFRDQWVWIIDRGKVVQWDENNKPTRMTGTLKNINHMKKAEEQLHLFKRSIENISDGVFIADNSFRFISVNQAYCKYTGQSKEQALATYLQFQQYPEAFTEEIKKTLKHKGNWSGELESVRSNGEKFEIDLNIDAIHNDDGAITHFVGVFSDITSRKTTEKELLKLANTDPLTDLPNRSFFQASHQNLVRKNTNHALLCLDMDNFKKINDSMGHQVGDSLIKQVAKRIQKLTGNNATCYRLGGDEFAVLVDKTTDVHRITHFAQFILDEMARPFLFNKQEFVLGASLGISIYPIDGTSSQELLKNADTAMYFAKNAGGNKYQFFSGEMNQNAVRQLQIENLIRHGLKEDLFSVFYQPKIDIKTGKMVSMEALVRFEHPEKGIVSPNQFIPLSEETGQIIEIGEVVLKKACSDAQRWVEAGLFNGRVAVNISARQFELADLDDRIEKILQQTGLAPMHLECEITEGTLMQQPEQSLLLMQRLRDKGVHLALDDFGTGYSSLAYLKRFPLNTLKIDKAFIDGIATSKVDRHMCSAIITIAHNLGLKVVAEGVEEETQLEILRKYQCEMLQGYLYSKPINAERFEKLLIENRRINNLVKGTHD